MDHPNDAREPREEPGSRESVEFEWVSWLRSVAAQQPQNPLQDDTICAMKRHSVQRVNDELPIVEIADRRLPVGVVRGFGAVWTRQRTGDGLRESRSARYLISAHASTVPMSETWSTLACFDKDSDEVSGKGMPGSSKP